MGEKVEKESNNVWSIPQNMKIREISEFPIEALPKELKQYGLELAEELQVPVDMVATAILATLALANQGKYMIEGKSGWIESLNIYAINIAKPSERKSPTMAKIIKPILEYEKEENEKRKLEVKNSKDISEMYENRLKNLKAKIPKTGDDEYSIEKQISEINELLVNFKAIKFLRLIVDDITPEALSSIMAENNERIGIFSSEGGIFDIIAGRYNNNIANFDILLKGYSGDRTSIDRKGRETEVLNTPYITMMLFTQPIVLEEVFSNYQFRGKGLCARLLYCYPESKVGNRNVNSGAATKEAEENYNNMIKNLLKKEATTPKILQLSSEAYTLSQHFAECLEELLKDELLEVEDWAGKLHGNILRIAGNIHLAENIDSDNLIISVDTMKKAIKIGWYYLENAKAIYNIMGEYSRDEQIAKKIIRALKERKMSGTIKKNMLHRISRGKNVDKVQDIDEAVKILIEEGYIKIKEEPPEKRVGKPKDKLIELNPYVFKHK